jgi:oxygen-dependent protoporphyrinogen oxidase
VDAKRKCTTNLNIKQKLCYTPEHQKFRAMRSQLPEHALVTLLRQCYITPKCQAARHGALSSRSSRLLHSSSQQFQPRTFSSRYPRDFQARHGKIHDNFHSLRQLSSLTIPDIPQENVLQARGPPSPQFQGHQITQIAVLGGGITGLSTAYYLMRELPHAKVTIYEGSEKLGGWLQSKRVEVEGGSIVFEQGPRTLRPGTLAGWVTLEMVFQITYLWKQEGG